MQASRNSGLDGASMIFRQISSVNMSAFVINLHGHSLVGLPNYVAVRNNLFKVTEIIYKDLVASTNRFVITLLCYLHSGLC